MKKTAVLIYDSYCNFEICVALEGMIGLDDCLKNPIDDGFIVTDKLITSVAFNFIKFGIQFCKMVGVDVSPKTFGI